MSKKIAIVLFNLGGPDSQQAVAPFLFNLFNDPKIIGLPGFLRTPLAWLIARRRAPFARAIYARLGGGSPLLPNTAAQARALEQALQGEHETRCFIAMRYWHPLTEDAARQVKAFAPDRIILLPLYPQFSTTTTGSSFGAWHKTARKIGLDAPTQLLCCYPAQQGFVQAMAKAIRPLYEQACAHGMPRLLLSAHGLPEKIVKAGDPYQWQCEATARAVVAALAIPGLDWVNSYQSRVGPLQWIGPATDAEILRAGREKVPLVVAPIAFVSEHSETLVELDIEYAELAAHEGVPFYGRAPTASVAPAFIAGLAALVRGVLDNTAPVQSAASSRLCPNSWQKCPHDAVNKEPSHAL